MKDTVKILERVTGKDVKLKVNSEGAQQVEEEDMTFNRCDRMVFWAWFLFFATLAIVMVACYS